MKRSLKTVLALQTVLVVSGLASCAASGDQNGGSFTLDIFGNANVDDVIDESDLSYLQEIIQGSKEKTKLADANNDSVIDDKDIEQIKSIISGEEKELTFIDCDGITVTIKKPLKNIVTAGHSGVVEAVCIDCCNLVVI